MKRGAFKGGGVLRPRVDWPYSRFTGDFNAHLDDLFFWGYIALPPFRRLFTDPHWGMLNIEHKNDLTRLARKRRQGWKPFGPSRRSRARTPSEIQLIRYRSALNRQ